MQTLDSYKQFIETDNIRFGGNNSEIYFEVDDFDEFAEKIKNSKSSMFILSKNTAGDSG